MFAVTEKVLNEALAKLNAVKAKYKVIMPNGEEFGELEIVREPERKKRVYEIAPGTAAKVYRNRLDGLKVGDFVTFQPIEIPPYTPENFKKIIQSAMINRYGNGSQTTVVDLKTGEVQTMRIK